MKKLLEKISNQTPDKNGVRKSRWLLISPLIVNTDENNILTIPLPDGTRVEAELKTFSNVRDLLSLELTGVWGQNLAAFKLLPWDVYTGLTHRVGRFPRLYSLSAQHMWWGFIAEDDNPPNDKWWGTYRQRSPEELEG